ncbi:MAG: alpha/beta hydrolase [Flavobacteriales bacterium]|nr:alpha/beta hydrolase [Flavobacteriales bacterium]
MQPVTPIVRYVTTLLDTIVMRTPILPFLLVTGLLPRSSHAQDHVNPGQFTFTVDSGLVYGWDTNYVGAIDTLRLDLYKPIGTSEAHRPLLVLVHGGTWLGGCRNDPSSGVVPLAREFAGRGYVVASVDYRLGWHKDDFVQTPAGPPIWPDGYLALYPADSAEIKRALYRGMQDVKGAIRWLKARADQDSICTDKVFVGGESAGAFVALAVGLLDRPDEKPEACMALPDAPPPYSALLNATELECQRTTYTVDSTTLHRPDLGPVAGDLNLNGFDASVIGVADFFGGMPYEAFTQDWIQGVDTPATYLYHQTCDGIVLFHSGKPYTTLSANCNLGATPWHYQYPTMKGSGRVAAYLAALTDPPVMTTDLDPCDPFDTNIALFECLRYANNGSYHFMANVPLRAAHLAAFWGPLADDPAPCLGTVIPGQDSDRPSIHPQPALDHVVVRSGSLRPGDPFSLFALDGRELRRGTCNGAPGEVRVEWYGDLPPGTYLLIVHGPRLAVVVKCLVGP